MPSSCEPHAKTEDPSLRWALGFVAVLIIAHLALGVRGFEANDDLGMVAILKGLYGWAPSPDAVFMSPLLGALLRGGYMAASSVPWYSIMLYAGLALSAFSAGLVLARAKCELPVLLAGLLGLGVLYSLVAMLVSFASVSLLLAVTSLVLLAQACRSGMRWAGVEVFTSAVLLPAAYLLRPGLWMFTILFATPLLLALWQRRSPRLALQVLGPVLLCVVASGIYSGVLHQGAEYEEYARFNAVRGVFTDTERSSPTDNTPAALAAVGWSVEDYLVSNKWWLHDGNLFSAEKLARFLDLNAKPSLSVFDKSSALRLAEQTSGLLAAIAIWAGVMLASRGSGEKIPARDLLVWLALLAVVLFMMGVRFPPRFARPCYVMLLLYAVLLKGSAPLRSRKPWLTIGAVIVAGLLGSAGWTRGALLRTQLQNRVPLQQAADQTLVDVATANGPDTLVVDVYPLGFTFPFHEDDPALRLPVLATGWMVGSPSYSSQLKRFGLSDRSTVVSRMIDNPKVVLRHQDFPAMPFAQYVEGTFLSHLRSHYDDPSSKKAIGVEIIRDDRRQGQGYVYFRLVRKPM